MALVSLKNLKPFQRASQKALPLALRETLKMIFSNVSHGAWLVGGTCLAGFYAEHRRSDDLDLFVKDELSFKMTLASLKWLKKNDVGFLEERKTPFYYHGLLHYKKHKFTLDIVLDENIHKVGQGVKTRDEIWVASLYTLLMMKVAALVSRCSEKDLFDLDWILSQVGEYQIESLIKLGTEIDAGLNAETLLISLQGAILNKEACDFVLPHLKITKEGAWRKINNLKKALIKSLLDYQQKEPLSPKGEAIRQSLRDFKKS